MTTDPDLYRHSRMRWNTPLSEEHAQLLLDRLELPGAAELVDVGCGWGELLLRALERADDRTTGVGVDTDVAALERGRALAAERGLAARARFVDRPAADWDEPADRVLCVGSSHALGGTRDALTALTRLVRPGGRLLYGDGCWERPPTPAAHEIFGDDVLPLTDVVAAAMSAGWRVMHLSVAGQREWDDFESTWRAGREDWAAANPDDPRAGQLRAELDARLREYVENYRGVLGFCYLVLLRWSADQTSSYSS